MSAVTIRKTTTTTNKQTTTTNNSLVLLEHLGLLFLQLSHGQQTEVLEVLVGVLQEQPQLGDTQLGGRGERGPGLWWYFSTTTKRNYMKFGVDVEPTSSSVHLKFGFCSSFNFGALSV